nr:MAG TPA: hypothetical protein [Caudoviricetes sp.]
MTYLVEPFFEAVVRYIPHSLYSPGTEDTYCSVSVRLLSTSLSLSRYSSCIRSAYFELGYCL